MFLFSNDTYNKRYYIWYRDFKAILNLYMYYDINKSNNSDY